MVWRIVSAVLGFLPLLLLFGRVKDGGAKVVGRPAPVVFGIVWGLLALLWITAVIVASFTSSWQRIVLLQVFSVSTLSACLAWLILYGKNQKKEAAQILLLCLLFASLMAGSQDVPVRLLLIPLVVWLIGATLFNYLEINAK